MFKQVKRLLFGSPLKTESEIKERLNVPLGLAIFASDALSSSAYATDEILFVLVGTVAATSTRVTSIADNGLDLSNLYLCMPVAIGICMLLAIVVVSYRQVIKAYPSGGGAYIVAKDNLGSGCSLLAAAALMLDYVLTVAVSVSAGIAAIMATFHAAYHLESGLEQNFSVTLGIGATLLIVYMNLRGIKESGRVIALPAYSFILSMLGLIGVGVFRSMVFEHGPVAYQGFQIGVEHIAVGLLFLKAFAHGCAALTGIEAISNGVKAFNEPAPETANKTMLLMGSILAVIFIGLTYLALVYQVVPVEGDTVVSQIARAVFGGQGFLYYIVQWSTAIILLLAANTSFGGFPRLAMILAEDGFMPRQMMNVGDRLVFSNGIVLLGCLAIVFIVAFHGSVHALMPMYAIGVFLSFTLAQAGMVIHHAKKKSESSSRRQMAINALGAVSTGAVCLLLSIEKFVAGAWLVFLCIPIIIFVFHRIKRHYVSMKQQLTLSERCFHQASFEQTVLVIVASLNKSVIPALQYARNISSRVEAVHVELNPDAAETLRSDWAEFGCDAKLVILKSPYRSLSDPLMKYIDEVESRSNHDVVTIIIPELVPSKWWHNLLHNQTAMMIKTKLMFKPGKVVTTVRYHLK